MSVARRLAIDVRMVSDGGIGTYLQELLPRLFHRRPEWHFSLLGDQRRLAVFGWTHLANVRVIQATPAIFSVREQLELPLRLPADADLFWAPNYDIPVLSRLPLVVTIHDVNHLALPELLGSAMRRWYARQMMRRALGRARRVLFDSEFTRQETERLAGDPGAKGTVVHLGVDASWRSARQQAPERPREEPYFLYVGNIKRHKNVPFLLRVFGSIMERIPHRLVLIGRTEGLRADPEVEAGLKTLGGRAVLLGERSAAEVRAHVAHAEAVVTASLYEGFGLPALEALAAGTPCLVSTSGSLPEICGDAALYADPRDERSFAAGMLRIATDADLRQRLVHSGLARAAQFDWDRCADQTAELLSDAC